MNSLHSVFGNLVIAGSIYGWRIDVIVVGGLLGVLMVAIPQAQRPLSWSRRAALLA